mmetsp:Transcript_33756/g.64581  ORF Transcript_33756/g.64581 Transcript_33756/m.64581 type:complete len:325 (-) Transcript_33756:18-992(-)
MAPWRAGNEYLQLHAERMDELRGIHGWSESGGVPPPLAVVYASTMIAPLRRIYSWALPEARSLALIAEHSPRGVVEVGAGTGYWAAQLRKMNLPVAAFDLHPTDGPDQNGHHVVALKSSASEKANAPPFTYVAQGGAEVASKFPERTLLLCWPPCEEPSVPPHVSSMAHDALQHFSGNTVVYVGELSAHQGSTAGGNFHSVLYKDWDLQKTVTIPQWPNATDTVSVWLRRNGKDISAPLARNQDYLGKFHGQLDSESQAAGAGVRQQMLSAYEEIWQQTAIAHMMARVQAGGDGARAGTEKTVLEAVAKKSSFLKRMMLRVLRA